MSATQDTLTALSAIVEAVDNVRVFAIEDGAKITPGAIGRQCAVVFSAPSPIIWETFCQPPSSATFVLNVIGAWNGRFLTNLLQAVEDIVTAVESGYRGAAAVEAVSSIWTATGSELPSYQITFQVAVRAS